MTITNKSKQLLLGLVLFMIQAPIHAQQILNFDFGTGAVSAGYTQVKATDIYGEEKGFGFDYGCQAILIDRGGKDPLTSDFATATGSVFFSVRLPQGNYRVTVTLGDPISAATTTIKAESRRLMAERIQTKAGTSKTVTFNVSVWDSIIRRHARPGTSEKILLKPRERTSLDWDNKLTLEFSNTNPCIQAVRIEPLKNPLQVFLMGNSTVTDQSLEPWASWGQMIPAFFENNRVVIANMAASGATLKSTLNRKRLAKVAALLHKGDYVFIEFAHNDQKEGSGEEAFTTYNAYLKLFADTVLSHGAIPVFVTSTNRRVFDSHGQVVNTLGDFPRAMRAEAKKEGIALIDLNGFTKTLYEAFGEEGSRRLFVQYPAGSFPGQQQALADNTHFNDFGAYEIARCVVEGLRRSGLDLKNYLKKEKELPVFDPQHPDDFDDWSLPLTPFFSEVKPYGN